ncbi:ribosomal protein L36, putative [Trypanosoma equiperdum]|uniref:Ribosomal protein L36, putative n=4 Tax=Trypanozoon TaxID=39700 RepID=Q38CY6_TRYB2|nr:ribosomal protein L36, putative [Trypanosoma brucei gambiense DAL972]XP_827664.1 ribosomal protein L36, putative [Trypanosoma brucei brucei TREU927]4V8M_Bm Chain Bm, RIBOSOMAL PROTEIN L36, PUTATIVE [Trypanosoma brucei brucei TREU927]8OVA_Bm Chain Bm, Ribosomal protein L36, putative [Trypanosoma brucei brucei]8OVE_Bm Chain Bm, Ribosomal protein L36, putative [Trypanosoma brucei brucei]RHW66955.1 ribosomal protein L36 [Trypanosoma brucei equiperdum]SCU66577.1 ribosomal protein L36, putative |eukprot:XP_011777131.1 ribosomal protein L36, putative [Trypanosoma brucei gambiense DAL972]
MAATKREAPVPRTGIIAGFNKGYKTTRRARRPSSNDRYALPHKKLRAVKAIISDLVGFSPMERRVQELLRVGKDKRALKFCKKRLGSIKAAKKRRAKVEEALRQQTKKK